MSITWLRVSRARRSSCCTGPASDSARLAWRRAIGTLAQNHEVFAPDWPGYGESDKPDIQFTTEFYVEFLGRFLDALGLEKASLVGISLGAGMALGFALRSPERVDKLVLVDSFGLGRRNPWPRLTYLSIRLPLLDRLAWAAFAKSRWIAKLGLQMIVYDSSVITSELIGEISTDLRKPGAGQAARSFQRAEVRWNGVRTSFVNRLSELEVPTLILHGANDRLVPVSWAKRAHRLIRGSELHILPECGHWLNWERPEELSRIVQEFLSGPQGGPLQRPPGPA